MPWTKKIILRMASTIEDRISGILAHWLMVLPDKSGSIYMIQIERGAL